MDIDSVSKVIITVKNKILFLQKNSGEWELPGGHLTRGETFQQGAIREVFEETGIKLRKLKPVIGEKDFRMFQAKPKIIKVVLSDEHVDYKWVKPDKILKLKLTSITHRNIKSILRSI